MVKRHRALSESDFSDCCMVEAYEGGLDVIIKYGSSRRPQGLSLVGTGSFAFRRIFSSLTYLLICPFALLNPWVVRKLEWNPLQPIISPSTSTGLSFCFVLFCFFFFFV